MDLKSVRLLSLALLTILVAGSLVLLAGRFASDDAFMVTIESGGVRYRTPDRPFAYTWYLSVACRPASLDQIYVLTDPSIAETFIGNRSILEGFYVHLQANAGAIGWEPSLERLTVTQMRELLESGRPAVIVDPLGYWPAEISPAALRSWIETGGVFIWMGDRIGAWQWTPGGPVATDQPLDHSLWGRSIYDERAPQPLEAVPLPEVQNLGLVYRWATHGPSPQAVAELGGRALGWRTRDGRRVSHAIIPLGQGAVVVFGGRLAMQRGLAAEAAQDIVVILYRGLTDTGAWIRPGYSDGDGESGFWGVKPGCPEAEVIIGSPDRWVFRHVRERWYPIAEHGRSGEYQRR
ncbi:hypothetical protein HRbin26_01007 [bacterium HR26]|nr:hypothetical protein HRbin26_01007 [bacterium HR26]